MASILDFLDTDTGKQFIHRSSKEVDESPNKVKSVLAMALPMLMGAIKKNSSSAEGSEKLETELNKEKHNGSILDSVKGGDLSGLISEGSGIVGHVLGGKQAKVAEAVSSASGMDSVKVAKLIKLAAPVIMGILGKQKRMDNVGKGGISELVGSVMGSNSSHDQSLLETFLDADDDSSIAGDITGKLLGGKGRSKGLGGFFKG